MLVSTCVLFLLWLCVGFGFKNRRQIHGYKQHKQDTFLFSDSGISGVVVKELTGDVKGKILTAAQNFEKGDIVLSIDPSQCIISARDGQTMGLHGQTDFMWEIAGDLREPLSDQMITNGRTWDVQLSLALLEATAGTGLMGEFWDQYTHLLQTPEQITPIFTWSEELIRCLDDEKFYRGALDQKKRLANLFPDLVASSSHRVTQVVMNTKHEGNSFLLPTPLEWAFAMVRSRCFQVHDDWFAVIPVMEIANHDPNPNANFMMMGEGGQLNYSTPILEILRGKFCLQALKDIEKGEQICIQYKEKGNNRLFLQQYGFSLPSASVIFDSGSGTPYRENTKVEDLAKTLLMGTMLKNLETLATDTNTNTDLETQRRTTTDILITKLETLKISDIVGNQNSEHTVDEVCELFRYELIQEIENNLLALNKSPTSINGIYDAVKFLVNKVDNEDDFNLFEGKINAHVGAGSVIDLRSFLFDQYSQYVANDGVKMLVNKYQFIALMTYKLYLKFALLDAKLNILRVAVADD